jgi:hypothetical protein
MDTMDKNGYNDKTMVHKELFQTQWMLQIVIFLNIVSIVSIVSIFCQCDHFFLHCVVLEVYNDKYNKFNNGKNKRFPGE